MVRQGDCIARGTACRAGRHQRAQLAALPEAAHEPLREVQACMPHLQKRWPLFSRASSSTAHPPACRAQTRGPAACPRWSARSPRPTPQGSPLQQGEGVASADAA